ncbi:macrophage migration inhibitory factor homolog [Diorhabda carinulata]|uniref:macrophage migration inhibitory factor homolog n=1 Tax=Diorhabda carinulata TaxID=1163345 RepID=UPI0025A11FCA|nr:macrophage migration inhibitory factor homolog [Diorhabda carinulata]
MPHFRVETNVPHDKIPADLPAKLCHILAKSLGKPIDYCCATVIGGAKMAWGGKDEPAAQATLMSIGCLGVEENKEHAKELYECITQELGIPANRMYIFFQNATRSDVGYNGTTFHEIFGR